MQINHTNFNMEVCSAIYGLDGDGVLVSVFNFGLPVLEKVLHGVDSNLILIVKLKRDGNSDFIS